MMGKSASKNLVGSGYPIIPSRLTRPRTRWPNTLENIFSKVRKLSANRKAALQPVSSLWKGTKGKVPAD